MDEAHNVERVAEEVASFELHVNAMYAILKELEELEDDIRNYTGTEKQYLSKIEHI